MFSTGEYNVIIGNISWNLSLPLSEAYLFVNNDYDHPVKFNDKILHELNDHYLEPSTRSCTIDLWTNEHDPAEYIFEVPDTYSHGMNYYQILMGLQAFCQQGRQQYGPDFTRNMYIKGIYVDATKYSKITGPYLGLDYWDL